MKKSLRSVTACFLLAAIFSKMPPNAMAATSKVSADDAFQAGYRVAENAAQGIYNTVIESDSRLDVNQVYMAVESLYPLYFTMLYYPNYNTTLDITISASNLKEHTLAQQEAKSVVARIIKPGMTTMERAKAINDYIAGVCVYDQASADNIDKAPDQTFTAYGALTGHRAVCAGYSRAFFLLCDMANVPCVYVPAPAMNHAFNAVSLYGSIRYVDVTYNDAYASSAKYRDSYFMLTKDELSADHVWDENLVQGMMNLRYSPAYFSALGLYDLGLFKGTDKGFELDRQLTRAEAAVMLVRLLGAEPEAIARNYGHPFTDVPSWADPYVGYLYQNGLTNGISKTEFGSGRPTTLDDYLTFMLRTLGYKDGEDFEWSQAESFAAKIGAADKNLTASCDKQRIRPRKRGADQFFLIKSIHEKRSAKKALRPAD